MKRMSMDVFAVLCLASLACGGGGGGGGSKACGDLASAVNSCLTSIGEDANPDMEAICKAAVCPSKQTVIDTVTGLKCDQTMQDQSFAAWTAGGCKFPATCQGVAYTLGMCAGQDVSQGLTLCNATTCTGSKDAAMACITALDCETATYSDLYDCMTAEGCAWPT